MKALLATLRTTFPNLHFTAGEQFYWSPESGEVFYDVHATGRQAEWSLLHETGHALLEHKSYSADIELLRLEVAAWEKACELAKEFAVEINEDHIQNSLDTYRDWLYKRSVCPKCDTKSLQQGDFVHYRCFNCHTIWKVGSDRFRRAYRLNKKTAAMPQSQLMNRLQ